VELKAVILIADFFFEDLLWLAGIFSFCARHAPQHYRQHAIF
jgi:hypothetical protein